jgi:DNA-binding MarR family transcriptional regulator
MSSLRIDTLRLCWLEAFVAVAEAENISQAARDLGIDQTTVSRQLKSLEKWLGKPLFNVGIAHDPEDARVSVGSTEEGLQFFEVAEMVIEALQGARSNEARYGAMFEEVETLVAKLEADLKARKNDVIETIRPNVEEFRRVINGFNSELPLDVMDKYRRVMRQFFASYELRCKDSARAKARQAKRSVRLK